MSQHPIGTRVIVTDTRTIVGGEPLGSGRSPYVGKIGTVVEYIWDDSHKVEFDDDWLSGSGSWSFNALDVYDPDAVVPEVKTDAPEVEKVEVTRDHHDDCVPGQKITDFEVGDRVTVRDCAYTDGYGNLTPGEVYTVVEVLPHGVPGAGSIRLEEVTNTSEWSPGYDTGAFGHLIFAPMDKTADVDLDEPDAPKPTPDTVKIGDRIVITARRCGHKFEIGQTVEIDRGITPTDVHAKSLDGDDDGADGYGWYLAYGEFVMAPADDEPADDLADLGLSFFDGTATLLDGTVVRVGDEVRIDTSQFGWNPGVGNHGDVVTITSIRPRTSGGWIIGGSGDSGAGFEWFRGIKPVEADDETADLARDLADALKKCEELESERDDLLATVNQRNDERVTLTQAASDERRRLCAEIDTLKAERDLLATEADARNDRDSAIEEALRDSLADTVAEANEIGAALDWILTNADDGQRRAVDVFREGFRKGAQD